MIIKPALPGAGPTGYGLYRLIRKLGHDCIVEGVFRPKATAFYVAIQDHGVGFRYLVTAEHVVSGLQTRGQEIWVRANLKNGRTREDRLSSAEWWMHPGSETEGLTDVASTGLKNRTEPAISLPTRSIS